MRYICIGQIEDPNITNRFCIWKEAGQPLSSLLKEDAGLVMNSKSPKRLGCSIALFLNESEIFRIFRKSKKAREELICMSFQNNANTDMV